MFVISLVVNFLMRQGEEQIWTKMMNGDEVTIVSTLLLWLWCAPSLILLFIVLRRGLCF